MAEADLTVAADSMVVGTGNPLLERVRTAGSVELPAVLFLLKLALVGRPANSGWLSPAVPTPEILARMAGRSTAAVVK
jgi:hypothetical protein